VLRRVARWSPLLSGVAHRRRAAPGTCSPDSGAGQVARHLHDSVDGAT
jgi:hypothetical protein